jgi:hypothetical protein
MVPGCALAGGDTQVRIQEAGGAGIRDEAAVDTGISSPSFTIIFNDIAGVIRQHSGRILCVSRRTLRALYLDSEVAATDSPPEEGQNASTGELPGSSK